VAKQKPIRDLRPIIAINPYFNGLLIIVIFVLFGSLFGVGLLAFFGPQEINEAQRQFAAMCDVGWKMTLGTIVGLLGGRAAKPDYQSASSDN
jgi:hypothetical protein